MSLEEINAEIRVEKIGIASIFTITLLIENDFIFYIIRKFVKKYKSAENCTCLVIFSEFIMSMGKGVG